jgi:hypothetical protein
VSTEQDRPAQLAQDPCGRDGRLVGVADTREEHRELVAALAADDILGPDRIDEPLGDSNEDLIPGRVAVGVVDPLEVVEVDEEEGDRPGTATPSGEGAFEVIAEEDPVGEPRQLGRAARRGSASTPGASGR